MRAFYILLFLAECLPAADVTPQGKTTDDPLKPGTNQPPYSYVSDYRALSTWFSLNEIETRTWKSKGGQTYRLMSQEVFHVDLPDLHEVLVAAYTNSDSGQHTCLDFYASREGQDGNRYLLLCHDPDCPPYKAKVTLDPKENRRIFFTIDGEFMSSETSKRMHIRYFYELNPKWQMVRYFSEFEWEAK